MSVYTFTVETNTHESRSLGEYAGKVLLIVNTASDCIFTPQYKELQALYEQYHSQGFEILGFPCNQFGEQEPGSNEDIQQFCEINYGVTFPIFNKIDVKGSDAHPLFQYLIEKAPGLFTKQIKWNFTKFIVNRQGEVVKRFAPNTSPAKLEKDILKLLTQDQ